MIEAILPRSVIGIETWVDLDEDLFPEEEKVVARAVPARQEEFRSVRACARQALKQLGIARPPLVPDTAGAPQWPEGIIGSMTHCRGYRAAVIAEGDRWATIGVDAEVHAPLPDGVLDAVSVPAERSHLAELIQGTPEVHWDRLLFGAKESVYKAWYPLTKSWLGFEDARIRFHPGTRRFTAELSRANPIPDGPPLRELTGRWHLEAGFQVTIIVLPAPWRS